jgi:hypothetical protein
MRKREISDLVKTKFQPRNPSYARERSRASPKLKGGRRSYLYPNTWEFPRGIGPVAQSSGQRRAPSAEPSENLNQGMILTLS